MRHQALWNGIVRFFSGVWRFVVRVAKLGHLRLVRAGSILRLDRAGPFLRRVPLLIWVAAGMAVSGYVFSRLIEMPALIEVEAIGAPLAGRIDAEPRIESTHHRWFLPNASIRSGPQGAAKVETVTDGTIEIGGPAWISVEALEPTRVMISLRPTSEAGEFRVSFSERHSQTFHSLEAPVFVTLRADLASLPSVLLPLQLHDAVVGKEPRQNYSRQQSVLRSGRARIFGRTLAEGRVYETQIVDLKMGDVASFVGLRESAKAIVRVGADSGLTTLVRGEARELRIQGFFVKQRLEGVGFLDVVFNDRLLGAGWSLLGLSVGLLGVWASRRLKA
jgi:hypothetical protein